MAQVELAVRTRLKEMMEARGWLVKVTHGNVYMSGLPDLLCWHKMWGMRMVEIKTPRGSFTPAQKHDFMNICLHGGHIWVLVGDTPINDIALAMEINKLRSPPNWSTYLK